MAVFERIVSTNAANRIARSRPLTLGTFTAIPRPLSTNRAATVRYSRLKI